MRRSLSDRCVGDARARISLRRASRWIRGSKRQISNIEQEIRITKEFQAFPSIFNIPCSTFDIQIRKSMGYFKALAATFSADAFSVGADARFAKDSRSSSPA